MSYRVIMVGSHSCPACMISMPYFMQLQKKYKKLEFLFLEGTEDEEIDILLKVVEYPTFIVFKGELEVFRLKGPDLDKSLEKFLKEIKNEKSSNV